MAQDPEVDLVVAVVAMAAFLWFGLAREDG